MKEHSGRKSEKPKCLHDPSSAFDIKKDILDRKVTTIPERFATQIIVKQSAKAQVALNPGLAKLSLKPNVSKVKESFRDIDEVKSCVFPLFTVQKDDVPAYVHHITNAMVGNKVNKTVQQKGCKAISRIAVYEQFRSIIWQRGTVKTIFEILDKHSDPRVIDAALGALMNLALDDEIKDDISNMDSPKKLLSIMNSFEDDFGLQRNATGFIRNMTHKNFKFQEGFISNGGLQVLSRLLEMYTKDKVIEENLLATLLNMTIESANGVAAKVLGEWRAKMNYTKSVQADKRALLSRHQLRTKRCFQRLSVSGSRFKKNEVSKKEKHLELAREDTIENCSLVNNDSKQPESPKDEKSNTQSLDTELSQVKTLSTVINESKQPKFPKDEKPNTLSPRASPPQIKILSTDISPKQTTIKNDNSDIESHETKKEEGKEEIEYTCSMHSERTAPRGKTYIQPLCSEEESNVEVELLNHEIKVCSNALDTEHTKNMLVSQKHENNSIFSKITRKRFLKKCFSKGKKCELKQREKIHAPKNDIVPKRVSNRLDKASSTSDELESLMIEKETECIEDEDAREYEEPNPRSESDVLEEQVLASDEVIDPIKKVIEQMQRSSSQTSFSQDMFGRIDEDGNGSLIVDEREEKEQTLSYKVKNIFSGEEHLNKENGRDKCDSESEPTGSENMLWSWPSVMSFMKKDENSTWNTEDSVLPYCEITNAPSTEKQNNDSIATVCQEKIKCVENNSSLPFFDAMISDIGDESSASTTSRHTKSENTLGGRMVSIISEEEEGHRGNSFQGKKQVPVKKKKEREKVRNHADIYRLKQKGKNKHVSLTDSNVLTSKNYQSEKANKETRGIKGIIPSNSKTSNMSQRRLKVRGKKF
mmetsp:Transcript_28401/g.64971  ORF Transcript_28401/g.64971 Transcript_28401/m.64971 type:complete len:874 (-) Transcript_28401:103-2724(-)